jgi:integrase
LVPLLPQRTPVPRAPEDRRRAGGDHPGAEAAAGTELGPTNTLKREIKDYVADRLATNHWTKNNAYNSQFILMAMADFVGVKEPSRLSARHLQEWYENLKSRPIKPLTEYSAHAYMRAARTFLKYLVTNRKLRHNVATEVKMARPRKSAKTGFCDRATVDRLIANCTREDLKFVLFCGFHAGLRKEEVIQSRPQWFDLNQGLLHVQRSDTWEPKDKDDRVVPMSRAFLDYVKNEYGLRSPFMLQPTVKPGKGRYRYDFKRPFYEYMAAQEVPWMTPHLMRHTFASMLASRGVSIYKIAKWLGDGVEVVQNHYAHLLPKDEDIEKAFD